MNPALIEKLNGLQPYLLSKIKGQNHVIERICSVLERGQLGLQPPNKPLGSMLFLGPTGVGKTETVREFSQYLFGDNHLFRLDMSEFLHADSVKLFIGDESGRPGRLGKILSQHQRGVFLFDEVEKAHHSIWDLFLQMLDAARITLADHRTHDLSGFYIICTSNIGSQQLLRPTRLPFATLERAVFAELHKIFRPELIGRFSEKVVFKLLSSETKFELCQIVIALELARLRRLGIDLVASDRALELLVRRGTHKTCGARFIKYSVQKSIGDAIRTTIKKGYPAVGVIEPEEGGNHLVINLLG